MEQVLAVLIVIVGIPALIAASSHIMHQRTMQQAYDRGYAVQCVGKTGYYWECEK